MLTSAPLPPLPPPPPPLPAADCLLAARGVFWSERVLFCCVKKERRKVTFLITFMCMYMSRIFMQSYFFLCKSALPDGIFWCQIANSLLFFVIENVTKLDFLFFWLFMNCWYVAFKQMLCDFLPE